MKKEIIQALKNDEFYDFIARNYYEISKSDLKDMILEIYYILKCEVETRGEVKKYNEQIIEYLMEGWEV